MRVVQYQTIYKDPAFYCGPGPSIVCDGGELTVVFRRVRSWLEEGLFGHWHPSTETCLTHSKDGGASWSQPRVIFAGHQCPCLTRLRDGTLVYHTHKSELVSAEIASSIPQAPRVKMSPWPGIHAGTFVHRSTDGGLTWSDAVFLDGVPDVTPLHPRLAIAVGVRGNILELADGCLVVSAYTAQPDDSYLFLSDDSGVTWSYVSLIANGYNETYLHETPSGTLLAYMRRASEGNEEAQWTRLHVAKSHDRGRSWSEPECLFKGYPACVTAFGSGNLCLAYGYRMDDAWGVRARYLSPEGDPLGDGELVVRDDGAARDVGYPHATTLPDGRALVVYYINRKSDATDDTAPRFIESAMVEEA